MNLTEQIEQLQKAKEEFQRTVDFFSQLKTNVDQAYANGDQEELVYYGKRYLSNCKETTPAANIHHTFSMFTSKQIDLLRQKIAAIDKILLMTVQPEVESTDIEFAIESFYTQMVFDLREVHDVKMQDKAYTDLNDTYNEVLEILKPCISTAASDFCEHFLLIRKNQSKTDATYYFEYNKPKFETMRKEQSAVYDKIYKIISEVTADPNFIKFKESHPEFDSVCEFIFKDIRMLKYLETIKTAQSTFEQIQSASTQESKLRLLLKWHLSLAKPGYEIKDLLRRLEDFHTKFKQLKNKAKSNKKPASQAKPAVATGTDAEGATAEDPAVVAFINEQKALNAAEEAARAEKAAAKARLLEAQREKKRLREEAKQAKATRIQELKTKATDAMKAQQQQLDAGCTVFVITDKELSSTEQGLLYQLLTQNCHMKVKYTQIEGLLAKLNITIPTQSKSTGSHIRIDYKGQKAPFWRPHSDSAFPQAGIDLLINALLMFGIITSELDSKEISRNKQKLQVLISYDNGDNYILLGDSKASVAKAAPRP
jgi:hypothetical protein